MTAAPPLQIQGRILRDTGFRQATSTAVPGDSCWHPGNLLCFEEFLESKAKVVMKVNRSLYFLLREEGGKKDTLLISKRVFSPVKCNWLFD